MPVSPLLPLFGQGLNHFQCVEPVVFGDVISDADDFAQARAAFHIRGRTAPRARHGRSRHERNLQLLGAVVDEFGIRPVVRECLSMNTGTTRPLARNTLRVSSQKRRFGY